MYPASYGVQQEVKIRRGIRQHEAEARRLARVAHDGQEPAVGGLLAAVAHIMRRTGGATRAGLERLRSGMARLSESQQECC
jgi:hypothetical protein